MVVIRRSRRTSAAARNGRVRAIRSAACAAALVLTAAPAAAQERGRFVPPPRRGDADFSVNNVPYDGRLTFVRLRFTPSHTSFGGGGGYFDGVNYQWDHDYPRADRHIMTIVEEITSAAVHEGTNIIALDDPELFKYPIAYLVEPGFLTMTDDEVRALRNYLLKGGFLIVDDFAGTGPFFHLQDQLRRVLPTSALVEIRDPAEYPIFDSFYEIASLDYEHPYYGVKSMFFGVFEENDPRKRLMVMVNFNNDVGEYWEWSNTGFIPIPLTNEAYKLGVNYLIYGLTH